MLDHVGLAVTDFERSKSFFIEALAPLEMALLVESDRRPDRRRRPRRLRRGRKALFLDRKRQKTGGRSARGLHRRVAIAGRRILSGCSPGRRPRQRRTRIAAALPSEPLRRLHSRPRRQQHRSGLPAGRVDGTPSGAPWLVISVMPAKASRMRAFRLGRTRRGSGFPLSRE